MTRFALPDLDRAFHDGERFGDGTIRVLQAGDLVLPTGRVIACDAYQRMTADPSEANRQAAGRAYAEAMPAAYRLIVPPGLGEVLSAVFRPDRPHYEPRSAVLDETTGANLIAFPSGEGDGCYS